MVPKSLAELVSSYHDSVGTCSGELSVFNISVKTAELSAIRVSYKIAKTVSRHAVVQISDRFGSDPAVVIPQRIGNGATNPDLNP